MKARKTEKRGWMAEAGLFSAITFAAACALAVMDNTLPSTWVGDASESTRPSAVSFLVETNGTVTVAFAAQSSPPSFMVANVVVDQGRSDSAFWGNYTAAGMTGVAFNVASDGTVPKFAMVFIGNSGTGRIWYNQNVAVSSMPGVELYNRISLDRAAGWATDAEGDPDQMWSEDLQNVDMIGVRFIQNGMPAQAFTVSEFHLLDADGYATDSAFLTPLQQALYARFGVTAVEQLTPGQKLEDTNADGMTDLEAILLEYDLVYANSVFIAQIEGIDQNGIRLKWPAVRGSRYSVYRSTDLKVGLFLVVPGGAMQYATETGYMRFTDTGFTGKAYYRIRRLLP